MFSQEATLGKVDAAPGATTHGQEGVQGFAALRDELEELGEIFQPMSAEEQGKDSPVPAPRATVVCTPPGP